MILQAIFSRNPLLGLRSVERQYLRLVHLLGFKPIKENLIVKLEKRIDVTKYHRVMVQEKYQDVRFIEEYMFPGKVISKDKEYNVIFIKNENETKTDALEIITKNELDIKEGEHVKVIIEKRPVKEDPLKALGRKIFKAKKRE